MFVIVVYDVNQKRVAKVLKKCRQYLNWVQNSVLEGEITEANYRKLQMELGRIIDKGEPLIIDRIIFTCVAKKMITKEDFEKGTEGIMLKEKAKKCFVQELDEKLQTTINHREIGRPVSYRRLIRLEVYKLEKHLMGEKEYQPFVANW